MKLNSGFFAFLMLSFACQKESPPSPLSPTLQVVWQHPLNADTSYTVGAARFLWQNRVVCSAADYKLTFKAQIQCRDADSGELLWKRDDFNNRTWFDRQIVSIADKTVATTSETMYCIDNNTGQNVWTFDLGIHHRDPERLYAVNEHVYFAYYSDRPPLGKRMALMRAHHETGQWDTLFNVPQSGQCYPVLSSVSLWINPQGDSVLIVPVHKIGCDDDLYAFNLRTRQMEWVLQEVFDGPSFHPPVISDNKMYINCIETLYCLDLLTRDVLWSRQFSNNGIESFSLKEYQNTILMVSEFPYHSIALSKADGSTVWANTEGGIYKGELALFEGTIFYTTTSTNYLHAIDAATGATILNFQSPIQTAERKGSFGGQGLCIDPLRRYLYVPDAFFVMCIKLPEM